VGILDISEVEEEGRCSHQMVRAHLVPSS